MATMGDVMLLNGRGDDTTESAIGSAEAAMRREHAVAGTVLCHDVYMPTHYERLTELAAKYALEGLIKTSQTSIAVVTNYSSRKRDYYGSCKVDYVTWSVAIRKPATVGCDSMDTM